MATGKDEVATPQVWPAEGGTYHRNAEGELVRDKAPGAAAKPAKIDVSDETADESKTTKAQPARTKGGK